MPSTTASDLTPEQQLEAIWWALGSARFWVSTNVDGSMVLSEVTGKGIIGRVLHQFRGTREEICTQLLALRTADRLDGISHDLMPAPAPDVPRFTF